MNWEGLGQVRQCKMLYTWTYRTITCGTVDEPVEWKAWDTASEKWRSRSRYITRGFLIEGVNSLSAGPKIAFFNASITNTQSAT